MPGKLLTLCLPCQAHHPGWQYMFWDAAACDALLLQRYPWFLDAWNKLDDRIVLKSGDCNKCAT